MAHMAPPPKGCADMIIRTEKVSLLQLGKSLYTQHLFNIPKANQGVSTSNSKISALIKEITRIGWIHCNDNPMPDNDAQTLRFH